MGWNDDAGEEQGPRSLILNKFCINSELIQNTFYIYSE